MKCVASDDSRIILGGCIITRKHLLIAALFVLSLSHSKFYLKRNRDVNLNFLVCYSAFAIYGSTMQALHFYGMPNIADHLI